LRELTPGDALVIESTDGRRHRYTVSQAMIVDREEFGIALDTLACRLTLMTYYPFDTVRPRGKLRYAVIADAQS
jgi:sortase (surface protein transpeptidase)